MSLLVVALLVDDGNSVATMFDVALLVDDAVFVMPIF